MNTKGKEDEKSIYQQTNQCKNHGTTSSYRASNAEF